MANHSDASNLFLAEDISWLDDTMMIDTAKYQQEVERLRAEGVIEEQFAEIICYVLPRGRIDSSDLAYEIGKNCLVWLAAMSTRTGADNFRVDSLDAWISAAKENDA